MNLEDKIQTWMNFNKIHDTLNQRLEKHLKSRYNLTISEFAVITVLNEDKDEGFTIHYLSNTVNLSHSAVSRLVARLETCHTVERGSHDTDKRSTVVKLTDQGRRDYQETLPEITAIISQVFNEEKDQMSGFLSRLLDR